MTRRISPAKRGITYKSYSFVDKDPIIDLVRTVVAESHLTNEEIEARSGVRSTTLGAWFGGLTKRPQFATVEAVLRACGKTLWLGNLPAKGQNVVTMRAGRPRR